MKILIIADVHGRNFWIEPCSHHEEFDKIIFLGDYHDPYPYQVSQDVSRYRLRDDLLPFVLEHRDKVVCLYGNHDSYIIDMPCCRADTRHFNEIKTYLNQMDLQLIYKVDKYLFSHSGVLPSWLDKNHLTLESLNTLPLNDRSLYDISRYRGGEGLGSCIWGDVREYFDSYHIPNIYQIFGHTQLEHEIIEKDFACLDCKKTFILDTEEDELTEYKVPEEQ